MDISGRFVQLHLSPEGRKALRGLVPPRGSFPAQVVEMDDRGLLVWRATGRAQGIEERIAVMLLRWDYIATMTFDLTLEEPPPREPIGFSPA